MGVTQEELKPHESRVEAVCLGVAVVVAGYGVTEFGQAFVIACGMHQLLQDNVRPQTFFNSCQLAYALMLALPTWRRSGICIGDVRRWWPHVLFICGLPVVITALVYPRLDEQPFAKASWSFWVIGPPAEDLIFSGFLYGRLRLSFTGQIHPRVPIHTALFVTAWLFSFWHAPMLAQSVGYGLFQMLYTFVGGTFVGLIRQWTGSVLYGMMSHMAVNAIACYGGFGG
jgi:membrane protease YdiL (CAAX protease family)